LVAENQLQALVQHDNNIHNNCWQYIQTIAMVMGMTGAQEGCHGILDILLSAPICLRNRE
jgi:hypothetical protein